MKLERCLYSTLAATAACAPVAPAEHEPNVADRSGATELQASASAEAGSSASATAARRPPASSASILVPTAQPPFDLIAKLEASLAARAVDAKSIARSSLFTWTTLEQAREIAGGAPVLSKEASVRFGPSAFDWMIDGDVKKGDRIAKLVNHAGFAKKRFAWPNSYGAALGLGGERYGTVLMRVDLASDALIVDYPRRRVLELSGKVVTTEELVERPGRLAAVYWEGEGFREYVLLNESKIASVHIADAEVMNAFMQDRAMVSELRSALRGAIAPRSVTLLERFTASLVFQKAVTEDGVREMEAGLSTIGIDGVDHVATPKATFRLGAPRAALKDDCKMVETRDISYRQKLCAPAERCVKTGTTCSPVKRGGIRTD